METCKARAIGPNMINSLDFPRSRINGNQLRRFLDLRQSGYSLDFPRSRINGNLTLIASAGSPTRL